jgi:hypothetical protein
MEGQSKPANLPVGNRPNGAGTDQAWVVYWWHARVALARAARATRDENGLIDDGRWTIDEAGLFVVRRLRSVVYGHNK